MTAGLAFEGLNQAGDMGRDLIVVLNDNEMSISPNVGALSSFLSRNLSARWVRRFKRETEAWLKQIPGIGEDMAEYVRKSEGSFKGFFTPGMLFEAFRFNYMGPIDGHNIEQLTEVFEQVRGLEGPVLVHVLTKKGKGYEPAESNPTYYHGVGCFEPETGEAHKLADGKCLPSYTDIFGQTLCELAQRDPKIVAITAPGWRSGASARWWRCTPRSRSGLTTRSCTTYACRTCPWSSAWTGGGWWARTVPRTTGRST